MLDERWAFYCFIRDLLTFKHTRTHEQMQTQLLRSNLIELDLEFVVCTHHYVVHLECTRSLRLCTSRTHNILRSFSGNDQWQSAVTSSPLALALPSEAFVAETHFSLSFFFILFVRFDRLVCSACSNCSNGRCLLHV